MMMRNRELRFEIKCVCKHTHTWGIFCLHIFSLDCVLLLNTYDDNSQTLCRNNGEKILLRTISANFIVFA